MKRLLREPLLHFLLIGAALFVLYGLLNRGQSGAPREIVISEARVEALAENFATVWMRPPTADELKGLIDDYVAEEVYYREAVAMGLDQDDTVIRRRLRQKMEFIAEDVAAAAEPTDAQLQAYLEQHADKFRAALDADVPAGLSQRRSAWRGGAHGRREAAGRTAGRRGPADPAEAGDATLLPRPWKRPRRRPSRTLLARSSQGRSTRHPWASGRADRVGLRTAPREGDERVAGSAPSLAGIRPIVLREWQSEQRRALNGVVPRHAAQQYEIRVEGAAAGLFAAPPHPARRSSGAGPWTPCSAVFFAAAWLAPRVEAHEVRPAFLEIREAASDTFDYSGRCRPRPSTA